MAHKRFPEKLAFLLNNPIRRFFEPPEELVSKLAITSEDVVLDFGCGPGFFTVPLAKVARRTVGVDVSSAMLEKAGSYAKKRGVPIELLQSDGTQINLPDACINAILLVHVFHEIANKRQVLKEFSRILLPAGRVLIVEKTKGKPLIGARFGPPIVDQSEIFREITDCGFTVTNTLTKGNDAIIEAKSSAAV